MMEVPLKTTPHRIAERTRISYPTSDGETNGHPQNLRQATRPRQARTGHKLA